MKREILISRKKGEDGHKVVSVRIDRKSVKDVTVVDET